MRRCALRTTVVAFALVSAFSGPAFGRAQGRREDVSALLEPIRAEARLPALGGAIVAGDRVTAIGVTGVRQRGSTEAATVQDRWHIGSNAKAMTATVAARLVERGRLRWDLTLGEALADTDMHDSYREVTLAQLLSHRAGIRAPLTGLPIWSWLWSHEGSPEQERAKLVEALLARRPAAAPGTKYLYSNGGYVIAGALVEQAAGEPFEATMQSELFEPLGLATAGFGAPEGDAPWGHNESGRAVAPGPRADNPIAIAPAGTIHASLIDWARFVSLHLSAYGTEDESGLISPATLRRLHTPAPGEDYAFGWGVTQRGWANGTALQHAGSNTMWYAVVWMAPARNFAVLVVTNQGGERAAKATDDAAGVLIRHHLGR